MIDTQRRSSFDREAELYSARRPHYPAALFDALVAIAGLTRDSRILEIGPGPGHATKPLAERGFEVVGVEIGPVMADLARRNLKDFPRVNILNASFEEADLPEGSFDLVVAARAFHWIDHDVRYSKPHALTKPGGCLAIVRAHDVSDEQGDRFFYASKRVYRRYGLGGEDGKALPGLHELAPDELDPAFFELVHFAGFPAPMRYSGTEYAELVNTYSETLMMTPSKKEAFLRDLRQLIDTQFDGEIARHFVMSLTIGRARP